MKSLALLLAFPVMAASAACTLPGTGLVSQPRELVQITSVIFPDTLPKGVRRDFSKLAETFHKAHPDIQVTIRELDFEELLDDENRFSLSVALGEGTGVDVLLMPHFHLASLRDEGLIQGLQPFADETKAFADDFLPGVLDLLREDGELWGLPAVADPWVLFYNKDLFDAAGVAYPRPGWTWQDFRRTARELQQELAGPPPFIFGSVGTEALLFVYQHGGSVADDLLHPTTVSYDAPLVREAVRWYTSLALDDGVMPLPSEIQDYKALEEGSGRISISIVGGGSESEQDQAAIEALARAEATLATARMHGDVAMWISSLSGRGSVQVSGSGVENVGVVPLPRDVAQATFLDAPGYFLSRFSPHPREAWLWLEFLTNQALPLGLPARRSVAQSSGYQAQMDERYREALPALLEALDQSILLPPSLAGLSMRNRLTVTIGDILAGELGVDEALDRVQERAEADLTSSAD